MNDDAGTDGSFLDDDKLHRFLAVYEKTSDRRVKIGIMMKLMAVPMKTLLQVRGLIPHEIKEGIVTLVLQKDGLQSSFMPAELDMFLNEAPDTNTKFGMGVKKQRGHVPEEFDGTSIASGLNLALETPKYLGANTTWTPK